MTVAWGNRVATAAVALTALLGGAAPAPAQAPLAPTLTTDTAFAPPSGIAKYDFTSGTAADVTGSIAYDPDRDRIYTVGETRGSSGDADIAVLARHSDGSFDTSFSGDGRLTIPIGGAGERDAGFGVALLPDRRLRIAAATDVAPGSSSSNLNVAIVGLNPDGSKDTLFGGGTGVVVFAVGAGDEVPTRIAVDESARIAVTGTTTSSTSAKDDFFVSLRNPDGTPAPGFGTNGVVTYNRAGVSGTTSLNDGGTGVAFGPHGEIVTLIQVETNPDPNVNDWHSVLHTFTDTGADFTAFSDDGDLDLTVGTPDTLPGGLLVYGGRYWVTGSTKRGADTDAYLARVNLDGLGLDSRLFDMRGRAIPSDQAVTSQGNDLAVVPGPPATLVVGGAVVDDTATDLAAAAFNGLDGDLASMGYGDDVIAVPNRTTQRGIVGVAPADGWVAVGGTLVDTSSADTSFVTARLLVDADKSCDLAIELVAPLEIAFDAFRPAAVQLRVTNKGTKACSGTISPAAPYAFSGSAGGPISTGLLLPDGVFTTNGVQLTYSGPQRRDDVTSFRVTGVGDRNAANDTINARVTFAFCDVALARVAAVSYAPNEGTRSYEFTVRNTGSATCQRVHLGLASGGLAGAAGDTYALDEGRSVSDTVSAAVPRGARIGAKAHLVFSARSSDDIAPANDSVTQTPIVIGVGDTNLTAVGRAGLRGRARAGHGPVAAKRLRVRRVDVAVQRLGGTRCRWLASTAGRFRTHSRSKGGCTQRVWLRARGVRSWRLGLRSALPRGRYVAFSRATIAMGFPEASFTAKDRNRVAFTVR